MELLYAAELTLAECNKLILVDNVYGLDRPALDRMISFFILKPAWYGNVYEDCNFMNHNEGLFGNNFILIEHKGKYYVGKKLSSFNKHSSDKLEEVSETDKKYLSDLTLFPQTYGNQTLEERQKKFKYMLLDMSSRREREEEKGSENDF